MAVRDTTVTIDGLNQLRRALKSLEPEAAAGFRQAGYASATIVADEAKTIVPVLTGRLRDTIRAALIESGGKVRAGIKSVPYAGPIHFGWGRRNITPQPFLYSAIDSRRDEVLDTYLAHLEHLTAGYCAPTAGTSPKARTAVKRAAKSGGGEMWRASTQDKWDKLIEAGVSGATGGQ